MKYDTVKSVQIILSGEALRNARREVRKTKTTKLRNEATSRVAAALAPLQAWLDTRSFKGPHFRANHENSLTVAVGAATVNVGYYGRHGAGEYMYPLHTVARIKTIAE